MALVLIPEGGLHSSRQLTQHERFTLLIHQDNQPSSRKKKYNKITPVCQKWCIGSTNTNLQNFSDSTNTNNLKPFINTLYRNITGFLGSGNSQCGIPVRLFQFSVFSVKTMKCSKMKCAELLFCFLKRDFITLQKKGNCQLHLCRTNKKHKYCVAPCKTSTTVFIQFCIALSYIILRFAHKEH